ncbi:hypothetical protein ACFXPQ_05600 [Streptomyces lydicus]|uniref:hypothetical protein n=1 Tax=Streptomyces lydicus TaxID=47763 RepID=UPI0036792F70
MAPGVPAREREVSPCTAAARGASPGGRRRTVWACSRAWLACGLQQSREPHALVRDGCQQGVHHVVLLVAEGGRGIDLRPVVLVLDRHQLPAGLVGDLGEPLQVVRQVHHTRAHRPHDRVSERLQGTQARVEGELKHRLKELLMQVYAGVNRRSYE